MDVGENRSKLSCLQIYIFYLLLVMIGLAAVGIDPWALFSLMSSFVLGFSFMISGASSDYFRGLLFILAQRPVRLQR